MSNFGGGFSPWMNGIPPCFVPQDNAPSHNHGFHQNRSPRSNFNKGTPRAKNWPQRRPLMSSPPAGKRMKLDSQPVHLEVTIPGGNRGRTVSGRGNQHGGKWLPRNKSNVPFVCFVCNKYFSVEKSFLQHLQAETHIAKEKLKMSAHNNARAKQNSGEARSESATRSKVPDPKQPVAGSSSEQQQKSGLPEHNQVKTHYCRDCKINFTCGIVTHRQSAEHKKVKMLGRPYCSECQWFFKTPKKYVEHCKNRKHTGWRKLEGDKEHEVGVDADMSDFVTVDAVGIYVEDRKTNESKSKPTVIDIEELSVTADDFNLADAAIVDEAFDDDDDNQPTDGKLVVTDKDDCPDPVKIEKEEQLPSAAGNGNSLVPTKDQTASGSSPPGDTTTSSVTSTESQSAAPETGKDNAPDGVQTSSSSETTATEPTTTSSTVESNFVGKKPTEPEKCAATSARKPVGLSYIIPITGFFCKICRKIFREEAVAKSTHCQSEDHYLKYQAYVATVKKTGTSSSTAASDTAASSSADQEGVEQSAGAV